MSGDFGQALSGSITMSTAPVQLGGTEGVDLPLAVLAHRLAEARAPGALARQHQQQLRLLLAEIDVFLERHAKRGHPPLLEDLHLAERRIAFRPGARAAPN